MTDEERYIMLFDPIFFCIRRLIFSLTAVFWGDYIVFQMLALGACTSVQLAYLWKYEPLETKFMNRMEMMNEVTALAMLYTMLLFTPWMENLDTRYWTGYFFVGIMITNISIHFAFLLKNTFV